VPRIINLPNGETMTIQTYPEDASPAVVTDTVEDKVVHSLSIYPRGTTPYVGS